MSRKVWQALHHCKPRVHLCKSLVCGLTGMYGALCQWLKRALHMSESLDVGKWGLKHACYVQVWKLYNTKTMDFHLFFCAKKAQELQVCTNLEIHLLPFPYIRVF